MSNEKQKEPRFMLYRVFYGDTLVYLGRTKQSLQDRIRGHLFKQPMQRTLFIDQISKIEYASFETEADMNIYEIYFINLWKPPLNIDDKTKDSPTIVLPEVEWNQFETPLWEKWKKAIAEDDNRYRMQRREKAAFAEVQRLMRRKLGKGEISEDTYFRIVEQQQMPKETESWEEFLNMLDN